MRGLRTNATITVASTAMQTATMAMYIIAAANVMRGTPEAKSGALTYPACF